MKFIEWYKTRFEKFAEPPPADSWNYISDAVDLYDVWKGVKGELGRRKRKKIYLRGFYALSLLFLFSAAGIYFHLNTKNDLMTGKMVFHFPGKIFSDGKTIPYPYLNKDTRSEIKPDSGKKDIHEKQGEEILKPNYLAGKKNIQQKKPNAGVKNIFVPEPYDTNSEAQMMPDSIQVNESGGFLFSGEQERIKPLQPHLMARVFIPDTLHRYSFDKNEENNISEKRFYFGGTAVFANNWLINNTTINGLFGNSLNRADITFGEEIGLSGGYLLKPRVSIEGNYYFHQEKGQDYRVYKEGNYREEEIELEYSQINVSSVFFTGPQKSYSLFNSRSFFSAGVYFAKLKNDEEANRHFYSLNDFGITLGYGKWLRVKTNWIITASVLSDIGLKNIYMGNAYEPGNFNNTHPFSLGARVGLFYLIPGK